MARQFLVSRLHETGVAPYLGETYGLPYAPGLTNLIGQVGPDDAKPPLVLGAHYDTVPTTPGADDNAAAVAIALEVATRLVSEPPPRRVLLALFDAEEPPYFHGPQMGSNAFVSRQLREPVDTAVIMDLVGHAIALPQLRDAVGVMGCESHPELAAAVTRASSNYLPIVTLPNEYMSDMSDHAAFRRAGGPFLFLTCGQWEHYHGPTDTPDVLDYSKMASIADLVEALVRDLASRPALLHAVPHDTSALDYEKLTAVMGAEALAYMGVNGPSDIGAALRALVARVAWA